MQITNKHDKNECYKCWWIYQVSADNFKNSQVPTKIKEFISYIHVYSDTDTDVTKSRQLISICNNSKHMHAAMFNIFSNSPLDNVRVKSVTDDLL